jgi:chorismate mutase
MDDPENIEAARSKIDDINHEIVRLLARRSEVVDEISEKKEDQGDDVRDIDRERELIRDVIDEASKQEACPRMVQEVFRAVLKHSVARQRRRRDGPDE